MLEISVNVNLCYTDVGGQILYGVQPRCPVSGCATVRGLFCNQEKRDLFRVRFTNLIAERVGPPIASGTVTVHFWPVIDRDSGQAVDDLFVVGMLLVLCNCVLD